MPLEKAQSYFASLKDQFHSIFELVSDFEAIFPKDIHVRREEYFEWKQSSSRADVLSAVAVRFFQSLNRMMHERYILHTARLADPPTANVGGTPRPNLTIPGMQVRLKELERSTALIDDKATALCGHITTSARQARNRIIAHLDFETYDAELTLGGASDDDTRGFLGNLQQYSDLVARALDLEPAQLQGSAPGDALDLMQALEWAYQIRTVCSDDRCPFQRYDIRPVRGARPT